MLRLDRVHWAAMRHRLLPDRPGPLVGLHTIATRLGTWWVDHWPEPRVAVIFVGGNMAFLGDPAALPAQDLAGIVAELLKTWDRILIDASGAFVDRVMETPGPPRLWRRVILTLPGDARPTASPSDARVRRLDGADAGAVQRLSEDIEWISDTLGGPSGLAESRTAWGAFVGERLVSVAVPFFIGDRHEDVGVITEKAFRGRGLSSACAGRVVADIVERGRTPSWSTSPENVGSLRVAQKLGFAVQRDSVLYVVGKPIPGLEPIRAG